MTDDTKEFTAELISDGRVTIPKHIREELELKEADRVHMTVKKAAPRRKEGLIL